MFGISEEALRALVFRRCRCEGRQASPLIFLYNASCMGRQFAHDLPLWLITRPAGMPIGVLYPDFTFFSWPEAICPPERSHAHAYLLPEFERLRDQIVPARAASFSLDFGMDK